MSSLSTGIRHEIRHDQMQTFAVEVNRQEAKPNETMKEGDNTLNEAFDYHERLLSCLTAKGKDVSVSVIFKNLQGNAEKIEFALNLLNDNQLIPKVTLREAKDEAISLKLRKRGNSYYSAKKWHAAVLLYNQSIAYAEPGSENVSLGYANRSALYFEWGMFERCLENIEWAKAANYPDHMMAKLDKRKADCEARLAARPTPQNPKPIVPKLSFPPHPKVPYIADCLELTENEKFGRHIVTTKPLKPGDIVVMEKPFDVALLPGYKYSHCTFCLKQNELSLIPCPSCTSAMFCSVECMTMAYDQFHKYECPIIDALYSLFTKIYLMAVRLVLTTIHQFKSMDGVEAVVQEIGEKDTNPFTLKSNDRNERFKAVHMLATNEAKRNNSDMFQRSVLVGILFNLFMEHTDLKALLEKDSHKDLFLNILARYSQASSTNFHTLGALERINTEECDTQTFGSAVFPLCSMLNHSCTPNVVRICHNTTDVVVVVYRPIKKGQQLLDCYGFHHCLAPKQERKRELEMQYKFVCDCEACSKSYPIFHNLPRVAIPSVLQPLELQSLQKLDVGTARNCLAKFKAYLAKYDPAYYPSQQISETQESLVRCFEILFGNISMNTKD